MPVRSSKVSIQSGLDKPRGARFAFFGVSLLLAWRIVNEGNAKDCFTGTATDRRT